MRKQNVVVKILNKRQNAKDERIEMLAAMDRDTRHEYLLVEKQRGLMIFGLVTAVAGCAYVYGRRHVAATTDTVSESPINDSAKEIIFAESTKVKEAML